MMRYLILGAVVLIALVGLATVVWGDTSERYVPEAGLVIDARFVSFYDDHGGRQILGLPITEAFIDPKSGLLVQYFENTRLELVSTDNENGHVQLAPLGQIMYGWDKPDEDVDSSSVPGCRFFPDARFSVCHSFLAFFERHGGVDVFGLPISNHRVEDGNLVQLFQRFRLEWRADRSANREIQITPLGISHFEQMGYSQDLLRSGAVSEGSASQTRELHIETSLSSPLLDPGATQVVFVTVRDNELNPLEGASTLLTATFATGTQYILLPITDRNGVTVGSLTPDDQASNSEVILEFLVQYDDTQAIARDSFVIR